MEEDDSELAFLQETSAPKRFAQQWKLRAVAQEAIMKEIAKSKLRRLSARKKTWVGPLFFTSKSDEKVPPSGAAQPFYWLSTSPESPRSFRNRHLR